MQRSTQSARWAVAGVGVCDGGGGGARRVASFGGHATVFETRLLGCSLDDGVEEVLVLVQLLVCVCSRSTRRADSEGEAREEWFFFRFYLGESAAPYASPADKPWPEYASWALAGVPPALAPANCEVGAR